MLTVNETRREYRAVVLKKLLIQNAIDDVRTR
jgi:hypothetical protein